MEFDFALILMGHLVGDYLLQSKEMALRKTELGLKGFAWCFLHSMVYALTVCVFLWSFDGWVLALVFMTHFPLDRWSLASKWLRLIRGRDFVKAVESKDKFREVDIAFSCLVYAVADNTMHLVLMYYLLRII
ncbi:MAG: DUF3307 domain-containing protein [Candidatus Pacebacteria bacterium]|nr:DUF3307 domain-containing protein [Candidatus Paceibacterota bacterium]